MKHEFHDGSYGIGHTYNKDCPCKPSVRTASIGRSSGRYGTRQGYRSEVTFIHNELPEEKSK